MESSDDMKRNIVIGAVIIVLIAIGVWIYQYTTTPDTSLADEAIDNIRIGDTVDHLKEDFIKDQQIVLEGKQFYKSRQHKGMIVRVSNKSKKVSAIIVFKNKDVATSRNVHVGDTTDEVTEAYGDTYKKSVLQNKKSSITYKDRENKLTLKFIISKDHVKRIELFSE